MSITRSISSAAAALAAMLVLAPAALAGARTPDNWALRPAPAALTATAQQHVLPDNRANRMGPSSVAVSPTVIVRSAPAGFDWGDAAIGAAAMLGLTLTAGAGVAGYRTRRRELAA